MIEQTKDNLILDRFQNLHRVELGRGNISVVRVFGRNFTDLDQTKTS